MGKKTSIYLTDDVRAKLRTPPRGASSAVSETIERYSALIMPEAKRVREILTEGEWQAVCNACNGTLWSASSIRGGVLADIQDSLDSELVEFGADRAALEAKLASLSVVGQFALIELIEQYWEGVAPAGAEPED
jgi:hypothetical protein